MFTVFTRNWYKVAENTLVPDSNARKTIIRTFETEEEARDYCREGNTNRSLSWKRLSRKYEYTSNQ